MLLHPESYLRLRSIDLAATILTCASSARDIVRIALRYLCRLSVRLEHIFLFSLKKNGKNISRGRLENPESVRRSYGQSAEVRIESRDTFTRTQRQNDITVIITVGMTHARPMYICTYSPVYTRWCRGKNVRHARCCQFTNALLEEYARRPDENLIVLVCIFSISSGDSN